MRRDKIEIYVHIMWTTWNRDFLLTPEIELDLFPILIEMGERHKVKTLAINGVPDHLHWLAKFSSTTRLCDLVKDAKGTSSQFLNAQLGNFKWRPTYAAYSVSQWNVRQVAAYIAQQKEHHAHKTWREKLEPGEEQDPIPDEE